MAAQVITATSVVEMESVRADVFHTVFQGAVEGDQLAARGVRTAGLSSHQPPVLGVSEPARLPFCPQELPCKDSQAGIPSVPESNLTV